jgi:hypothetical protein
MKPGSRPAGKIEVFQHVERDALAGSRQPAHDDQAHRAQPR